MTEPTAPDTDDTEAAAEDAQAEVTVEDTAPETAE